MKVVERTVSGDVWIVLAGTGVRCSMEGGGLVLLMESHVEWNRGLLGSIQR